MSPASRKRKHPAGPSHHNSKPKPPPSTYPQVSEFNHWHHPHSDVDITFGDPTHSQTEKDPLSALYIQAYEADIVRGPEAGAAKTLEISSSRSSAPASSESGSGVGSALMRWGNGRIAAAYHNEDGDEPDRGSSASSVWVDRYDARLLLDSLPPPSNSSPLQRQRVPQPSRSPSPGWSDLPSDTEDTFFFSPSEIEDLRLAKRRRALDEARDERVRAKAHMEGEDEDDEEGGVIYLSRSHREEDDEERPPSPQTLALMHRTAAHIRAARDPAQLELRILANWGGDKRFAFLRSGRWAAIWEGIKRDEGEKAKCEEEAKTKCESQSKGLGGLEGYGSDDDDNSGEEEGGVKGDIKEEKVCQPEQTHVDEEEAKKEARRKRAKVWAEMRRAGGKDPG